MKEYSDLLDAVAKQAQEDRIATDWKYKTEKNGVKVQQLLVCRFLNLFNFAFLAPL